VDADGRHNVQIKISERAIQLAPLVVETMTDLDRRKRASGTHINEIARTEIDDAARRGLGLGELLRQGMPSLSVRGNCVEYRGARRGTGPCREVHAVMDGVPVSSPAMLIATMPLQDIERLEILSPAEAGAIYGVFSGFGVLLIETRRGPTRERLREAGKALTAMDWSQETRPYEWGRVMVSSFAGAAAGIGAGMLVGNQCLKVSETDFSGLRPKCDPITTMAAGFVMLGLPGLAGGTAARWAGSTERSQGRLIPSALLSTLTVASGYLIWVEGKTLDSEAARVAGMSILFVGTPLMTAFSDRLFRALR
jgi:drug/metabolite transporter (DMT)-like permease